MFLLLLLRLLLLLLLLRLLLLLLLRLLLLLLEPVLPPDHCPLLRCRSPRLPRLLVLRS